MDNSPLPPPPPDAFGYMPLSNVDWEAFRKTIFDDARDHDHETAFGEDNYNMHAALQFIMHIYQCGRESVLPPEWVDAYRTMQVRRGEDWDRYQEAMLRVEELGKRMEQHEYINLSTVVGEPVSAVLQGELKGAPAPQVPSAHNKNGTRKRARE